MMKKFNDLWMKFKENEKKLDELISKELHIKTCKNDNKQELIKSRELLKIVTEIKKNNKLNMFTTISLLLCVLLMISNIPLYIFFNGNLPIILLLSQLALAISAVVTNIVNDIKNLNFEKYIEKKQDLLTDIIDIDLNNLKKDIKILIKNICMLEKEEKEIDNMIKLLIIQRNNITDQIRNVEFEGDVVNENVLDSKPYSFVHNPLNTQQIMVCKEGICNINKKRILNKKEES